MKLMLQAAVNTVVLLELAMPAIAATEHDAQSALYAAGSLEGLAAQDLLDAGNRWDAADDRRDTLTTKVNALPAGEIKSGAMSILTEVNTLLTDGQTYLTAATLLSSQGGTLFQQAQVDYYNMNWAGCVAKADDGVPNNNNDAADKFAACQLGCSYVRQKTGEAQDKMDLIDIILGVDTSGGGGGGMGSKKGEQARQ